MNRQNKQNSPYTVSMGSKLIQLAQSHESLKEYVQSDRYDAWKAESLNNASALLTQIQYGTIHSLLLRIPLRLLTMGWRAANHSRPPRARRLNGPRLW